MGDGMINVTWDRDEGCACCLGMNEIGRQNYVCGVHHGMSNLLSKSCGTCVGVILYCLIVI